MEDAPQHRGEPRQHSVLAGVGRRCRHRNMRIRHQVTVFDTADLATESTFWAGVLDGRVEPEDDWHVLDVDG